MLTSSVSHKIITSIQMVYGVVRDGGIKSDEVIVVHVLDDGSMLR